MLVQRGLIILLSVAFFWALTACGLLQSGQNGKTPETALELDTIEMAFSIEPAPVYQIPPDILIDIHHIELDLNFNWMEQEVIGKAKLSLSAYSKAQKTIQLDARGFEIKALRYETADTSYTPEYLYDNLEIIIKPIQKLEATDTVFIFIEYIARPAELKHEIGAAITSSQGLYFINPDGSMEGVPRQIWTQGEPECNSPWFPSVDHPHEKITHEIFLTVDSVFHTISNGKLIYSEEHDNGTRTDYWKQNKPHANYLVMLAIGEFSVSKDTWREIPVWYYVDEKYHSNAKAIFGTTPEMLEFYSNKLNYYYPWDKYHQVVVKDFVSGAMENTSAVIHGDFVQLSKRELLDDSHEDVIAHELFHHWFGDLVTCQSWSQLTLNEGFATYGEYLWKEHKYGLSEAQLHLKNDLDAYLLEASGVVNPLIRNHFNTPDDLFDSHTYQKGGRVMHMLRLELGDEYFFAALSHYLKTNEFGSVELDDFRSSVEKISGRSMRWFFDQWFENQGHPIVEIKYERKINQLIVYTKQIQPENWPTYRLNIPFVKGYDNNLQDTLIVTISNRIDTITMSLPDHIEWFAVDPSLDMLWEKHEVKTTVEWEAQLAGASSYIAREAALNSLLNQDEQTALEYSERLLRDKFWALRIRGLELIKLKKDWNESIKAQLIELTQLDNKSAVRAKAYETLDSLSVDAEDFNVLFAYGLRDSSYQVVRTCLAILTQRDPCFGADQAQKLELINEGSIPNWVSRIYASCPKEDMTPFFIQKHKSLTGFELYLLNSDFKEFAIGLNSELIFDKMVATMTFTIQEKPSWWAGISCLQALNSALNYYSVNIERIESEQEISFEEIEHLAVLRNKQSALLKNIGKLTKLHESRPSPLNQ